MVLDSFAFRGVLLIWIIVVLLCFQEVRVEVVWIFFSRRLFRFPLLFKDGQIQTEIVYQIP